MRKLCLHVLPGRSFLRQRRWLSNQGPILTRVVVDRTWDRATRTGGELEVYGPDTKRGGHAVCLVGYTAHCFIVRNSWGAGWGDGGFAYASDDYRRQRHHGGVRGGTVAVASRSPLAPRRQSFSI